MSVLGTSLLIGAYQLDGWPLALVCWWGMALAVLAREEVTQR